MNVTQTGAANYNVPIVLPEGINGMTPQLSISYNSQSGNGIMGIGWVMNGLSSISRTGTSFYHEEYVDGIDFDDNDKYNLDGNRLIPVEGYFRTEIETFSKIELIENGSELPWFKVWTKDGRILEYGRTTDSRIEAQGQGSSNVLFWLLNRVEDRKNNYIDYSYYENNATGEFWLVSINYTGNLTTGEAPFYTVELIYDDTRPDLNKLFISGSQLLNKILLDQIRIKYDGSLLKTYEFSYEDDFYSHLKEIQVSDQQGNHFNPTDIYWGDTGPTFDFEDSEYYQDKIMVNGDYNGDGFTDYFLYPRKVQYTGDEEWDLYLNDMEGGFDYTSTGNLTDNEHFVEVLGFDIGFDAITGGFVDFDLNRKSDFITVEFIEENGEEYLAIFVKEFDAGYNSLQSVGVIYPYVDIGEAYDIKLGDFNGDGKVDILVYNFIDYFLEIYSYNHAQLNFEQVYNTSTQALYGDKIIVGDFNGDRKSDIMSLDGSSCKIYEFTYSFWNIDIFYDEGFPTSSHELFPGDFNGDGITDVLSWTDSKSVFWELHLFDGTVFHQINDPIMNNDDPEEGEENYNYFISDYNGDGKSDILEVYNDDYYSNFIVHYSTGINFISVPTVRSLQLNINKKDFSFGDYNGDGKFESYLNSETLPYIIQCRLVSIWV